MGDNRAVIRTVVEATEATVQAGGGIRDEEGVAQLMAMGVQRVIVGTRAIDDPPWLEALAGQYPHRIILAADVRERVVVRKGWTESSETRVLHLLDRVAHLPLAGILCTDVSREGRMEGIDLPGAISIIEGSRHPVWISGGITTLEELRALDGAGAAGAVLGMAIYTGKLPPEQVAREFGT